MAKTTPEKLVLMAKKLASLSEDALNMFIDDAYLQVQADKFPETIEEVANRYLAAHLATMETVNVKSEAVSSLKKEYYDKNAGLVDLSATNYGQEYQRLVIEHTQGHGPSMVVV